MAVDVESLRERIASAESLHSIVETMRTLATVNIRRANQAAAASREYLRMVHLALNVALKGYPTQAARRRAAAKGVPTLLVLSSNQGLCGSFNERIVARAVSVGTDIARNQGGEFEDVPIVCVGYRGADRLASVGARVIALFDAPSSIEAVGPLVREIYESIGEGTLLARQLLAIFNRPLTAGAVVESVVQLLPFDAERWRALPEGEEPFETIPMAGGGDTRSLLAELVRELLYIDLYRTIVESFAAENAARLLSMQGATENIESLLLELNASYREARQDAITNELMDILAGMLAVEPV